ncbi:hypothetical protein FA13DRAFT_1175826 [Coprinellus micaceus]|uniref:Uncharacterized protein n=1 Tax=Coprinellus micaceus TaxID=71717 RepID=A0A4Y7STW5_COPMI|nr:hypothetical protein FA13DRAFT_1175826 [Coprinellus micaceus]
MRDGRELGQERHFGRAPWGVSRTGFVHRSSTHVRSSCLPSPSRFTGPAGTVEQGVFGEWAWVRWIGSSIEAEWVRCGCGRGEGRQSARGDGRLMLVAVLRLALSFSVTFRQPTRLPPSLYAAYLLFDGQYVDTRSIDTSTSVTKIGETDRVSFNFMPFDTTILASFPHQHPSRPHCRSIRRCGTFLASSPL